MKKIKEKDSYLQFMFPCPKCHGDGSIKWVGGKSGKNYWTFCSMCGGFGLIDWVQNVTKREGKRE